MSISILVYRLHNLRLSHGSSASPSHPLYRFPANMNRFSYVVPTDVQRMLFGWATVGKLVGLTVSLLLGFMSARRSLPINLQRQANNGPTQFFVLASRCFNAVRPRLINDRGPTLRVAIGPTRSLLVGLTLAHAPFANKTCELNFAKPTAALR